MQSQESFGTALRRTQGHRTLDQAPGTIGHVCLAIDEWGTCEQLPHPPIPGLWAHLPSKDPISLAGALSTLLFWMRRMRCSKQLLLRKVACSTGRSSHASIMGMASVKGPVQTLAEPLQAAFFPHCLVQPFHHLGGPSLPWEPVRTKHADPQGDKGLFRA